MREAGLPEAEEATRLTTDEHRSPAQRQSDELNADD